MSFRKMMTALVLGFCLAAAGPKSLAGSETKSGAPAVILVHGFKGKPWHLHRLEAALEKRGFECLAPELTPNDCRDGVRKLTQELGSAIEERYGTSRPLILVGFSMGGLITRDYVQNFAAPGRVRAVYLISTPNYGTRWASLSPSKGLRELGYHSEFVTQLDANHDAWKTIPVCNYWTPLDGVIVPSASCRWSIGESQRVVCFLHPFMIRSQRLINDVAERMEARRDGVNLPCAG